MNKVTRRQLLERKIVKMLTQRMTTTAIARGLHVGKKRVKQLRGLAENAGYLARDGGPGSKALPPYPKAAFPDRADGRSQKLSDEHIKLDSMRNWIKERLDVGWQPITIFEELPATVADVSRSSFYRYLARAGLSRVSKQRRVISDDRLIEQLEKFPVSQKTADLLDTFPLIGDSSRGATNARAMWEEYRRARRDAYGYSRYLQYYRAWSELTGQSMRLPGAWRIHDISEKDRKVLLGWRKSNDRRKWERAVVILDSHKGNLRSLCSKIERSRRLIQRWITQYATDGLAGIPSRWRRNISLGARKHIEEKKNRLVEILHQSPGLYNINRTSWRLADLSKTYEKECGESLSKSQISSYIRSMGYRFRKAKKVLTSPDPNFRAKLRKITQILSHLGPDEKIFSIDEYGPFAIKIQGGKALARAGERRTVPQWQKIKGRLIATAALELSTNQITHFYSEKKNTEEMIKLLMVLLKQYAGETCIYFSWDAASWHASSKLYERVKAVNCRAYRNSHGTPLVKLAPLPSSAQFLNVIESVFSGMSKAIIHNSNYGSVEECKRAIDRYFGERNQHFKENPKRAGQKIWGKELVKSEFNPHNNCKDPRY